MLGGRSVLAGRNLFAINELAACRLQHDRHAPSAVSSGYATALREQGIHRGTWFKRHLRTLGDDSLR
jgi:hypothetical protein